MILWISILSKKHDDRKCPKPQYANEIKMRGREIMAMGMDDQPWSLHIYQRGIIKVTRPEDKRVQLQTPRLTDTSKVSPKVNLS